MNVNKEIKFNGKEYVEYLKYKDSKKKKLSKKDKELLIISGIIILAFLGIFACIDAINYTPSQFKYTWDGIYMFLAISAGLGWIFHGTGFLLVRR